MADFGEYLPLDCVLFSQIKATSASGSSSNSSTSGSDIKTSSSSSSSSDDTRVSATAAHNQYPLLWARLNKEAVKESTGINGSDIVFFSRSAAPQSPGESRMFWTGDQLHTWDHLDGLESTVYASLSMSLSGLALTHSDVGGYTTINVDPVVRLTFGTNRTGGGSPITRNIRLPVLEKKARFIRQDRELFKRWMDLNAWISTALYRTHEGSVPVENLQPWTDQELAEHFAQTTKTFHSLAAYKRLLMREHQLYGYPLLRPLYLHYPHGNRPAATMERLQVMLGPLLLIIPVTVAGLTHLDQRITDNSSNGDDDEDTDDSIPSPPDDYDNNYDYNYNYNYDDDDDDDSSNDSDEEVAFHIQQPREFRRAAATASKKGHLLKLFRRSVKQIRTLLINRLFSQSRIQVDLPTRSASEETNSQASGRLGYSKQKPVLVAPSKPPLPRHGRPYLPPGRWRHLWTGRVFNITDPRGLFITLRDPAGTIKTTPPENGGDKSDGEGALGEEFHLACPPGRPPVFLREINREEMRRLLENGGGGEDIQYWLDELIDSHSSRPFVGTLLLDRAMAKYDELRKSLTMFL